MYLYGPVLSRRMGMSLGIDILVPKSCDLNCVYCQLGSASPCKPERARFIPPDDLERELIDTVPQIEHLDYITFSGSGEPTLSIDLGRIAHFCKEHFSDKKIALITNSTLLWRDDVIEEIKPIDLIVPSLDAADDRLFRRINRPNRAVQREQVLRGLLSLRDKFDGEIWLEVMLIAGYNDSDESLTALASLAKDIRPDRVHLNLPERPPAVSDIHLPDWDTIDRALAIFGENAFVVHYRSQKEMKGKKIRGNAQKVLDFLTRRPESAEHIATALSMDIDELYNIMEHLLGTGKIVLDRDGFYRIVSDTE